MSAKSVKQHNARMILMERAQTIFIKARDAGRPVNTTEALRRAIKEIHG